MGGRKRREPPLELAPLRSAAEFADTVHGLAEPLLGALGLELVKAEALAEPGGFLVRLYVDRPGGVTIEDCATANRRVRDLLDAMSGGDPVSRLEVSSPGPDRPLTREEHFNRFSGNTAVIKTHTPVEGRKKFSGVLRGASGGMVTLAVEGRTVAIPREAIRSARLHHANGEHPC